MLEEYNINQTTLKIIALYRDDYRKLLHVREIAREINVDVKAIQLQLRRLEGINILSSSLKGKNKDYQLNLANILTRYYLIMSETFTTLAFLGNTFRIKKLLEELGSNVQGTLVLYGSFVKSLARKDSDIDLFVVKSAPFNKEGVDEAAAIVARQVSVKIAKPKDFLKGIVTKDPLISEIIAHHIILKGVDEFCDILWRHYS
jgi:predicted nucleotidyltransferase